MLSTTRATITNVSRQTRTWLRFFESPQIRPAVESPSALQIRSRPRVPVPHREWLRFFKMPQNEASAKAKIADLRQPSPFPQMRPQF
jgi:hypothetical protein